MTWRGSKKTSWIREQIKGEDILTTINRKMCIWAKHGMHKKDNRWTVRVIEWERRDGKKKAEQT